MVCPLEIPAFLPCIFSLGLNKCDTFCLAIWRFSVITALGVFLFPGSFGVRCALVLTLWEKSLNEGHLELALFVLLQASFHSSE